MVSSHAAIVFLVAASSLLSHGEAAKMTAVAADYGYPAEYGYAAGSKLGPENWGKLSPEYKLCGEGKKQSPIDIVTKQAVPNPNLDSLHRNYTAADGTLVNNGKDILMTFEPGKVGTVTVNGKVYSFRRVHWHAPSEHTINGVRHPLELQMVHTAADGSLAIIAILYKYGAPDSFYFQLKKRLAELAADRCSFGEENAQVAIGVVHLRSLQKRTGSYFRYVGSLTAPPCTWSGTCSARSGRSARSRSASSPRCSPPAAHGRRSRSTAAPCSSTTRLTAPSPSRCSRGMCQPARQAQWALGHIYGVHGLLASQALKLIELNL